MRIIQSFAKFPEGHYRIADKKDSPKDVLNFYVFLLSYLTLNKYYGDITMFCNKAAYKNLIKYIPYDKIKFLENPYDYKMWSVYKVHAISQMKEDFIHVDSDVFVFDDIFSEFINNPKKHVIIQDLMPVNMHGTADFVKYNKYYLKQNLKNIDKYDGHCYGGGTLGLKKKHIKGYVKLAKSIYKGINEGLVYCGDNMLPPTLIEELSIYLYSKCNNLNVVEVLPRKLCEKVGIFKAGDIVKYSHMWFDSKFEMTYIHAIKNRIKIDFPQYYKYVTAYEKLFSDKLDICYKLNKDIFTGIGERLILDKSYI